MGQKDLLQPRGVFEATHTGPIATHRFTELVHEYIRFYASSSGHTARAKRLDLDRFIDFLSRLKEIASDKLKVQDWDHSSVQRFVDECLRAGEAPATVARRLATLKHMGRTLSEKISGFVNPAKEVKPPKLQVTKPKGLSEEDIAQSRELAAFRLKDRESFIRLRNATIFNFLLDTGLRAEEIRLLKLGQIDEKLEWIKNVRTKGRRFRNVYITSAMRGELSDYLKERQQKLKKAWPTLSSSLDKQLPLFLSTYNAVSGKPESFLMGAKSLWRAVRELSSGTKLHPHLLRHSFALELLNESNDIRLVAQALGHSDVRVTMRYTERKDQEVAGALERARRK